MSTRTSLSRLPAPCAAVALLALVTVATSACNFTKLAADQTVSVFAQAAPSFDQEGDVDLARTAALGQLKMFEGLLLVVPDNRELMLLTASSFAGFAFGFLEDDLDTLEEFSPAWEKSHARAVDFYGRAIRTGATWLAAEHEEWPAILDAPLGELEAHLATLEAEDAPGLFWIGFALANRTNITSDDPSAVVDLPRAKVLMARVVELDEATYHGVAHVVLGSAAASLPPSLGGEPEVARTHFERAVELTGGRYLMTKALYAHYYHARQSRDRDAWRKLLTEVRDAPADLWPAQRLTNSLARIRAERWLAREDEIFD